eukprot:TRINITY_DN9319_c0_g1_i1.p1 TRINITY_DN9319_c0_g1~~TRINITY_DN9319_c0_g1_i1.p1  ORF type:complete len:459 (+),score=93.46 TRINITY_DN9319_c0_g1_i1:530-1906(+)
MTMNNPNGAGSSSSSASVSPPHTMTAGTTQMVGGITPVVVENPVFTAGHVEAQESPSWRLDLDRFEAARTNLLDKDASGRFRFGARSALSGYYQRQNEMIDGFSEMDALEEHLLPTAADAIAQDKLERSERFAIGISNTANVVLLALKVFASIESRSLAVIASTLDSLLDLLSGFILWFTARSMRKNNPYKYPIGKKRMQPLGIIVFASVMATLGFQVLFQAGETLMKGHDGLNSGGLESSWPWLVAIMGFATIVKLCLFLYCTNFSNEIVQAYAMDHFFDVVTNVVGLAAALAGQAWLWWIDPVGAIFLALYTMKNWGSTVVENVNSLTGRSAPPEYLQKLTYLCWNHHPKIILIDTVRAYTFGSHYFTEVDIVLPPDMPLQVAHDIGESLQNKLERLPEIERAFVHLDFEVSHRPEHHGPSQFTISSTTPVDASSAATQASSAVPLTNMGPVRPIA